MEIKVGDVVRIRKTFIRPEMIGTIIRINVYNEKILVRWDNGYTKWVDITYPELELPL